MTYAEKLKDPRWQRKRLEVMAAAGFKCEFCGNSRRTLHVHHLKYTGDPWEAPMEDLECLCEMCHEDREGKGLELRIHFKHEKASKLAEFAKLWGEWRAQGKSKIDELIETLKKRE